MIAANLSHFLHRKTGPVGLFHWSKVAVFYGQLQSQPSTLGELADIKLQSSNSKPNHELEAVGQNRASH
jgi:hypothetical protein